MEKDKGFHPRNIYKEDYDFKELMASHPKLSTFVKENQYQTQSIDYSDPKAVLCLNQALLIHQYAIKDWSIPNGNLCPPVPGRADYIHYIADLLSEEHDGDIPVGPKVKGLDIGAGASCIYPILGKSIYGWKFVGSDIKSHSINHANKILDSNPTHKKNIKLRFQDSDHHFFQGIIKYEEYFDFTICNPPFYSSLEEAKKNSARKIKNLNINKKKKGHAEDQKKLSNFGGVKDELWCQGGELALIKKMIKESERFKEQCNWFTCLVSNKAHLKALYKELEYQEKVEIRTIEMNHGQKISHILAWRF